MQGDTSAANAGPTLIISANAFWNIANFRAGLIAALKEEGYSILVATPDADSNWGARQGVETADIKINRSSLNPVRDGLLLIDYYRLIRRICPSAFLSFTPKPNIYGAFAAGLCGVPAIPNVSGLGTAFINPGPLSALVGTLYRIAFRKCPVIFFQNPDDSELFVERKIVRQGQVRLLPGSGVDLRHFRPAAPSSGIRFLFIGRLLGDKGVREFIEAARQLRAGHPDWQFQLLGPIDDGNRSAITRADLDQWLVDGCVEYLGQADDVRPHIAGATAVVLPSYREGLPRSLLEAAAMERPLIATDVAGNRQIVRHGVNGLLCEVRNAVDLASAIERIGLMDLGGRAAMGRAGRALVEREFSETVVTGAYSKALLQLCASRRS